MAQTIKCEHDLCHCMLPNEPGAEAYCSPNCQTQSQTETVCQCAHEECGKQRELGSGPSADESAA